MADLSIVVARYEARRSMLWIAKLFFYYNCIPRQSAPQQAILFIVNAVLTHKKLDGSEAALHDSGRPFWERRLLEQYCKKG